nr:uncharacterized protein LOC111502744 [Leptinotarsa decemlineata]
MYNQRVKKIMKLVREATSCSEETTEEYRRVDENHSQMSSKAHTDYELMSLSTNLQPPPSLIPFETTTSYTQSSNFASDITNLQNFNYVQFSSDAATIEDNDSEVPNETNKGEQSEPKLNNFERLNQDLHISSSESDPHATDGDSDYVPSENEELIDENQHTSTDDNDTDHHKDDSAQEGGKTNKEVKFQTRKRKRDEQNLRGNIIKTSRNRGMAYENWKGTLQVERTLKAPCTNCRRKCDSKFTEELQKSIFTEFWNLGDINRQGLSLKVYSQETKGTNSPAERSEGK